MKNISTYQLTCLSLGVVPSDNEQSFKVDYKCKDVSNTLSHEAGEYSIELQRLLVRQRLAEDYVLINDIIEIDYLVRNPDVLGIIHTVKDWIKTKFGSECKAALELQNGGHDWETLFIIVDVNVSWEIGNKFTNGLLKRLFKIQPEVAKKINIIVSQDGL
jgi:hypothetical protein